MHLAYPNEAPSSVVLRLSARRRLDPSLATQALSGEIELSNDILKAMKRAGVRNAELERLASLTKTKWPHVALGDLDVRSEGSSSIGKACEVCLAEDVEAGRDHHFRDEWRLSWRVSCERHRTMLTEIAAAEIVPVSIDGLREYRIRFIRDVDQVANPFMRSAQRRGGRRGSFSVLGYCLESDICSALRGAPLPECWCLGTEWSTARTVLLNLADLLLTHARGSRERLIHRFAEGDWIPQAQARHFAQGCFPFVGAFWQRRILETCARILIDPLLFNHLSDGHRLNVHAELAFGRVGQQKARSLLGSLATSDILSLLFAYIGEGELERLEPRIRHWPAPLARRVGAAAAVALYIQ